MTLSRWLSGRGFYNVKQGDLNNFFGLEASRILLLSCLRTNVMNICVLEYKAYINQ